MQFNAEKTAKVLDIAVRYLGCGNPATVRAGCAINLIFHSLRDRLETPFYKIVPLQPGTETPVLFTVLLPVAFNLYEVCQHPSIISGINPLPETVPGDFVSG